MHELQVQAAIRDKCNCFPVTEGGRQEFSPELVEYHMAQAKKLRNDELRRLFRSFARFLFRIRGFNHRKIPRQIVVRT